MTRHPTEERREPDEQTFKGRLFFVGGPTFSCPSDFVISSAGDKTRGVPNSCVLVERAALFYP